MTQLLPSDFVYGTAVLTHGEFENGTVALTWNDFDQRADVLLHRRRTTQQSTAVGWDTSDDGIGTGPLDLEAAATALTDLAMWKGGTFALITDVGVTRSTISREPSVEDTNDRAAVGLAESWRNLLRTVLAHQPVGAPLVSLNMAGEAVAATIRTADGWLTTASSRTFISEGSGAHLLGGLVVIAAAAEYMP